MIGFFTKIGHGPLKGYDHGSILVNCLCIFLDLWSTLTPSAQSLNNPLILHNTKLSWAAQPYSDNGLNLAWKEECYLLNHQLHCQQHLSILCSAKPSKYSFIYFTGFNRVIAKGSMASSFSYIFVIIDSLISYTCSTC